MPSDTYVDTRLLHWLRQQINTVMTPFSFTKLTTLIKVQKYIIAIMMNNYYNSV